MRKLIYISIVSLVIISFSILIFLSTVGIKTDNFNNLIIEEVKKINQKIDLDLKELNFKFNLMNFEFEVTTTNPNIAINKNIIELETIKFDVNIFQYLNNKNPITQMLIESKENDINQFTDFINQYNFNIARSLIFKQIKKGKVKISSNITFDQNDSKNFNYNINGSIIDAEVKLLNQLIIENIKFDFQIDQNDINAIRNLFR